MEDVEKLKGDVKIPFKQMIKRIYKNIKPEMPRFILAFLLVIINVAISIVGPYIFGLITDEISKDTSMNLTFVIVFLSCYFVLVVVGQLLAYAVAMILQKSGQRITYDLRMEVFEHIEKMSQNQFNEMPVGSLVTRVTNYTASISSLFTDVLVYFITDILKIIGAYIILCILCYQIALIMLAFLAAVIASSIVFKNLVEKAYRQERAYLSDLNTNLNENLSGMRIIQLFNQQKRKEEEFNEKNNNLRKARYRIVLTFAIYRPFINLLYFSAIAVSFYMAYDLSITAGETISIYMYLSNFFNPIQQISDQINTIQKAGTACERLYNLLDVKPDVLDKEDSIEVDHFEGKIEFKNVWFAYKDEDWILKDVSFVINPKETCAFVGATGAGKTTILSLIVRNYEVQKGQILIDDIDIKTIKVESLRKAIGQMLQDVFLFSGTLKSNITLHDEEFTDDEVLEACRYVNADKFIEKTDEKLDEPVIERGENFSQGQRQLLSFARTVLHKPQILILDEATANIDTETEVLIKESLEKMKSIGTMLVVAHRLSTIQKSDQIIVLNHGEIVERGNHQSLLKNRGYYYKLYQLQFANK